jgi:hypothetical protein
MAKISVGMKKYDLSLIPNMVPDTLAITPHHYTKTKTTNKGEIYEENVNEVIVSSQITWTWVNNEDPSERLPINWVIVGQQSDASQAFGSGLTYCRRYFLLKFFGVATTSDDPDHFRSVQAEAEAEADKAVAKEVAQKTHEIVTKYLEANPDKRDEVVKVVGKYVKSCDYFDITESVLASRLLKEVTQKFNKVEANT